AATSSPESCSTTRFTPKDHPPPRQGVELIVIKELLGHAHIGVTATGRTHVRLRIQRDAINLLRTALHNPDTTPTNHDDDASPSENGILNPNNWRQRSTTWMWCFNSPAMRAVSPLLGTRQSASMPISTTCSEVKRIRSGEGRKESRSQTTRTAASSAVL